MHRWLRGFWVTPLELFKTVQAAPQLTVTGHICSSWPFQSLFTNCCWVGASIGPLWPGKRGRRDKCFLHRQPGRQALDSQFNPFA